MKWERVTSWFVNLLLIQSFSGTLSSSVAVAFRATTIPPHHGLCLYSSHNWRRARAAPRSKLWANGLLDPFPPEKKLETPYPKDPFRIAKPLIHHTPIHPDHSFPTQPSTQPQPSTPDPVPEPPRLPYHIPSDEQEYDNHLFSNKHGIKPVDVAEEYARELLQEHTDDTAPPLLPMSRQDIKGMMQGRQQYPSFRSHAFNVRKKLARGALNGPPPLDALLPEPDREYDVMINFLPEMTELEVKQMVVTYVKQVRQWGGKLIDCVSAGRREMAYPIRRRIHTRQVIVTIRLFPSGIQYLHQRLTQDELVLRFIILKPHRYVKRLQRQWMKKVEQAAKKGVILDPPPIRI